MIWEYRILKNPTEEEMNSLGRDGGDLVSVAGGPDVLMGTSNDSFSTRAFFKRRAQPTWSESAALPPEELARALSETEAGAVKNGQPHVVATMPSLIERGICDSDGNLTQKGAEVRAFLGS